MRLYKSQADAAVLSQKSLEVQNMQLQQDCAVLDGNVTALRRFIVRKEGRPRRHALRRRSKPDSALIARLEIRANQSEQRAESTMFQKNETKVCLAFATRCCQPICTNSVRSIFRCQLAELSLYHFQRLCDSSLSLLRASASNSNDALQFQNLSPPSKTAVSLHRHNHVQEAVQLLANAACRRGYRRCFGSRLSRH
jgi:hypothetical protein